MRILHTADWHLGKRLEDFSRLEEQKDVLEEICSIADSENVDAVLIAGDLFDTYNPSSEAVDLFYKTLKRLSANSARPVTAIAGNHDSPERIEVPDPLARECGIFFAGYPNTKVPEIELDSGVKILKSEPGFVEMKLPEQDYPLRLVLTPYANEQRLKTYFDIENREEELRQILTEKWRETTDEHCDNNGVNILLTHLFMTKKDAVPPEEPDDEKPILHVGGAQTVYSANIPEQIQYTAIGHLHRYQVVDEQHCPVIYSGSPLSYSFSEANQAKFVSIIDAQPGRPAEHKRIELTKGKKLLRARFDSIDDAVVWLEANPNSLVELTIVQDDYLNSMDRKRLQNAHDGIVAIIPEITRVESDSSRKAGIDLNKSIDELFIDYFKFRHEQEPNEELLDLFKEIRNVEVE